MSLFDTIKKQNALKKAITQVAAARESADEKADALFKSAYQGFEFAIHKELMISEALYNWGFALLHQAKTKTGEQAIALYQDAYTKFSFCLTIDPDYLGAAIDGGVALMDLARLKQVGVDDSLYNSAKRSFEKANKIQKGSASYNLACVYSLCHDEPACLEALQNAKECGSLPNINDIINDPDLSYVVDKTWFADFIASLTAIEQPALALEKKHLTRDEVSATDTETEKPDNELDGVAQNNETAISSDTTSDETVVSEAFSSNPFSSKSFTSSDNS